MVMTQIESKIFKLADDYEKALKEKIDFRVQDMQNDINTHYLIYRVLGITLEEGKLIDTYQNKGRFLYKYAGSFLEEATILCFEDKFKDAQRKIKVPNKIGLRPKTFEIDCLVNNNAYEIKWRDATTDGDHVTKEHSRLESIHDEGFKPVRIMFYYPLRGHAIRIQKTLETLYKSFQGEYYYGDSSWSYLKKETSVDLLSILEKIADAKL